MKALRLVITGVFVLAFVGCSDDDGIKPDAGTKDTGTQDTGTQDTGTKDTGTKDTGTKDTGADISPDVSADLLPYPDAFVVPDVMRTEAGSEAVIHGLAFDALQGFDSSGKANAPLAGATITVEAGGTQVGTTTTDAYGFYNLRIPAAQRAATYVLKATLSGYIAAQVEMPGLDVLERDFPLNSLAAITLGIQVAVGSSGTYDNTKGLVQVEVVGYDTGETVTISATNQGSLTLNSSGAPVQGNVIQTGITTEAGIVIFANVDVGTTTVTVTAPSGGSKTCAQLIPGAKPVTANTFTYIPVLCQ